MILPFTWHNHIDILKSLDHPQKVQLDVLRHGIGYSVGIDKVGIKAFRFQPDGVARLCSETFNFALQGWTVPRPIDGFPDVDALVKVVFNISMHLWIRSRLMAKHLLILYLH